MAEAKIDTKSADEVWHVAHAQDQAQSWEKHGNPLYFSSLLRIFGDDKLRIIEIGCGEANKTLALAQMLPNSEIWACDIDQKALEKAACEAERLDLSKRVSFVQADGLEYLENQENNSFEVAIANLVITHLDKERRGKFHDLASRKLLLGGFLGRVDFSGASREFYGTEIAGNGDPVHVEGMMPYPNGRDMLNVFFTSESLVESIGDNFEIIGAWHRQHPVSYHEQGRFQWETLAVNKETSVQS